eukprot:TRINITY_DN889_c0_g1_i1.p1 TRINITY_DN889_c0_g1~~TRINITY_DN889_c0_g1_i1.p1  ORF type:complete len:463 (-),score=91.34 TRINITY_DN889_c0_g1_i1:44-1432(-)
MALETHLQRCLWSALSTRYMFSSEYGRYPIPASSSSSSSSSSSTSSKKPKLEHKSAPSPELPMPLPAPVRSVSQERDVESKATMDEPSTEISIYRDNKRVEEKKSSTALISYTGNPKTALSTPGRPNSLTGARVKPEWHAPWKIYKVISGHLGWVRCISIDPSNEWFVTGSADRTIKIWDLASGTLKLTLTGHINAVRGVAVSQRHPYLFSVGEDKAVKCWDLEYNKVIRGYHGHLSGVYCVDIHPTIDVIITGGRDSTARVWDIRTKNQVHVLSGHSNTVASIRTQSAEPQVITGSHDCVVKLWDLSTGRAVATLTNHKKSVRALMMHPTEYTFASGSADNIKVWKCPEGQFLRNIEGHNAVVNCMAINQDNVMVSGADNGSLCFWDWASGYNFQTVDQVAPQPGSLDSESGIFASVFDHSGSRLLTCEADKTIKIWKEDETASPETHPINWRPDKKRRRY